MHKRFPSNRELVYYRVLLYKLRAFQLSVTFPYLSDLFDLARPAAACEIFSLKSLFRVVVTGKAVRIIIKLICFCPAAVAGTSVLLTNLRTILLQENLFLVIDAESDPVGMLPGFSSHGGNRRADAWTVAFIPWGASEDDLFEAPEVRDAHMIFTCRASVELERKTFQIRHSPLPKRYPRHSGINAEALKHREPFTADGYRLSWEDFKPYYKSLQVAHLPKKLEVVTLRV